MLDKIYAARQLKQNNISNAEVVQKDEFSYYKQWLNNRLVLIVQWIEQEISNFLIGIRLPMGTFKAQTAILSIIY